MIGRDPRNQNALEEAHREVFDQLLGYALGLVGAVVGLVWVTGQLAGLLFGQAWLRLGLTDLSRVAGALPEHLDDPAVAWPVWAQRELPGPLGMYAAFALAALLSAALATGVLRVKERLAPGRGRPGRLRTGRDGARWASLWSLRGLLVRDPVPGRLVLGRLGRTGPLLAAEDSQSVLVFGPPGSLKTTGIVQPAITEWAGPVVATSVKLDVLQATRADRARRGQLLVLDPLGLSGEPSVHWTPLASCGTWRGAQRMAETIAATRDGALAEERLGDHLIWERLGAKLLAPALHAAAVGGGEMADVVRWVDTRDPDDEVAKLLDDLGAEAPVLAWQASRSHSSRTQDSIYTTAEDLLGIYADPRVAEITSGHDLDFAWFLTGPHTLYLYAPAHEQKRLRPLFETVVAQLLQVAQETAAHAPGGLLDPRLLLALDEAGNVAALADLPELATTGRGQGIQLLSVWHDEAQLRHRYGTRAATVLNGHRAKIFLPGLADVGALELGSRLIGERSYAETTASWDADGRRSVSQGSTSFRPLVPVDALRQLKTGRGLVVYGNRRPVRVHLRPFFKAAERRRRNRADQRTRWQTEPTTGGGRP